MKAILDASFLISAIQARKDPLQAVHALCDDYPQMVVPQSVIAELKSLAASRTKAAVGARLALQVLEKNASKIEIEKTNATKADDAIAEIAENLRGKGINVLVCTNDLKLRKKVRETARVTCVGKDGKIS